MTKIINGGFMGLLVSNNDASKHALAAKKWKMEKERLNLARNRWKRPISAAHFVHLDAQFAHKPYKCGDEFGVLSVDENSFYAAFTSDVLVEAEIRDVSGRIYFRCRVHHAKIPQELHLSSAGAHVVAVDLLDFGVSLRSPLHCIFSLPSAFSPSNAPFRAVECLFANIRPDDGEWLWSEDVTRFVCALLIRFHIIQVN